MASLYVHIPFCQSICTYCDFCKVLYNEEWVDPYLDALEYEITQKNLNKNYETIYIGGGTPSALTYVQLKRLLDILAPYSQQVIEYSMESNPESMDEDKLTLLQQYRVNRLSIGVQTLQPECLQSIHRQHTPQQVVALIKNAQDYGITDINVDLMYGLPKQTLQDVYQDIRTLLLLGVTHISVYSLILEENTILKNEGYQPLSEEDDAVWFENITSYLESQGMIHYEISNYYKEKPSYHNLCYWHYQDYDGVGVSAHSLVGRHRLENTRSLTQYLNRHYLKADTCLSDADALFEKVMMGLRLTEGIDMNAINQEYAIDFYQKYQSVITKYEKLRMLKRSQNHLQTTELGMRCLHNILIDFLED